MSAFARVIARRPRAWLAVMIAITALAITISTILHDFSAAFAVEKVSPSEGGKEPDHD